MAVLNQRGQYESGLELRARVRALAQTIQLTQLPRGDQTTHEVLLTLSGASRSRRQLQLGYINAVGERSDRILNSFPVQAFFLQAEGDGIWINSTVDDLDWAARLIVRLGCPIRSVHPPTLKLALADLTQRLVAIS